MEKLGSNFPNDLFTPEETARFLKYKADTAAFYEKHGDYIDWLSQAHDAGLMERPELTPDDFQYMEYMAEMAKTYEEELKDIDGMEGFKLSHERLRMITHLQKESAWLGNLLKRKEVDAGKAILESVAEILVAAIAASVEFPEDKEIEDYVAYLKKGIAQSTQDITLLELELAAREMQSDN
jgi:hypothetical protein